MIIPDLMDLRATGRPFHCDCGKKALYRLPVTIRLSGSCKTQKRVVYLQLCDDCLRLEISGRKQCPAKNEYLNFQEV
jgi:hypothetical protein